MTRHFLKLSDLTAAELRALMNRALEFKRDRDHPRPLGGRTLAMVFQKSSTRTRVSFEVAMVQLGGQAVFLSPRDTQLGRGEPLADTARVLSSMCDALMVRNDSQTDLEEFARHSRVPVINGLTDRLHPCQLLADIQTWFELRGDIAGRTVAWVGDGNNVCNSWLEAAPLFDFNLRVSCPEGYDPDPQWLAFAGARAQTLRDPRMAVRGADLVVTDVWASMGQESEQAARQQAFAAYQVDEALMSEAAEEALFMHCLPAHRGEEVSAGVIDGPQSAVWVEAENRLHAQKALLELLLAG
jgi:ornithine carbamoyltransferase